jgi:DNA-binding response OmpR family regulator
MKLSSSPSNSSRRKVTIPIKQQYQLLLVDDDSDSLHVLKRGLEINGFQVDAFSSSQKALGSFKPSTYDLAILDIRMPGLSGFQLYREIKKIDPAITACFLSAFEIHPSEFEKVFPSLKDVKTIIKKPVSIYNLLREITPLLRISAIARAPRGEHFLVAFETPQELIEQSLQFLKIGLLEKEEDVLLVTDSLPKDKIRGKIAKEWNIDVKNLEYQGRIMLMTFAEWHLIDNKFDIQRSKIMMKKLVRKTIDRGRKGLRSVVDMNPFFSTSMIQNLVAWESSLEKQFDLPITSLCAYSEDNIKQLDNSGIRVMQKHHNRMMGKLKGRRSR